MGQSGCQRLGREGPLPRLPTEPRVRGRRAWGAEGWLYTWQVAAGSPFALLPGPLADLEDLFLWGGDVVGGPRWLRARPCQGACW